MTTSVDKHSNSSTPQNSVKTDSLNEPCLHVSFNKDASQFILGTAESWHLFQCEPQKFNLVCNLVLQEPVHHAAIKPESNLVAYARDSSLRIYDTQSRTNHGDAVNFPSLIRSVRALKNGYVVLLDDQARIVDNNLNKVAAIDSAKNQSGVCDVSIDSVVVFPAPKEGFIRVVKMEPSTDTEVPQLDVSEPFDIEAHKTSIECIAVSHDGSLCATASTKGTLIRVFDLNTRKQIREFRRGTKTAQMYSISFSQDAKNLCCYSSSGTVHLFSLESQNRYSSMYMLSYLGFSFLSSEWSMTDYSVPQGYGVCSFAPVKERNLVYVLTKSGQFIEMKFDKEDQEPTVTQKNLMNELMTQTSISRRQESERFRQAYPGKIPIILDIRSNSTLPLLKKRKFLVPDDIKVHDMAVTIQSKLQAKENIGLFYGEDLLDNDNLLKVVYDEKKDEAGFLYLLYDSELSTNQS